MSAKGGVHHTPLNAQTIGANGFALFTRNQLRWSASPLSQETAHKFKTNCSQAGFLPRHVLVHGSYLINLASPDEALLKKSRQAFLDEMHRCETLGLIYLVFHPGSHKGAISEESGLGQLANFLNLTLDSQTGVMAVIENTAGAGGNIGYRFEQLAFVIGRVVHKHMVGVCLDTCHLFAAGYDIRTRDGYEQTMLEFDRIVGFDYLKAVHLNDAKGTLGSRRDRHAGLGEGLLTLTPFRLIMNDPRLEDIPLILETPEPDRWAAEISQLRQFEGEPVI